MIRKLIPIHMVTAALLCGPAIAQETTEQSEAGSEVGSDLDLGETGPRVGEQYLKEESGDWAVLCLNTGTDNEPCAIRQILNGEEGQPIAELTVEKLPEGNVAVAAATVVVPLEVILQAQLALSIDGAPRKRYNYHHCNPIGCIARLGFTQGDIDAMKSGNKAAISMVTVLAPDQVIEIEASLKGFTAGYDGLQAPTN